MKNFYYYPKHLQIETVNKFCNARCPMCTIFDSPRKAEIMSLETFCKVLMKFVPYRESIEFLTLHGCGEPLFDKTLPEKIVFAKEHGFNGIGFSTNCGLLSPQISKRLLDAGLDTLIASIDGITKEVQEAIRVKSGDFKDIIANLKNYIKLRNEGEYKGRVLIRFIRQQLNFNQWDEYHAYWSNVIDTSKGDDVIRFDVHNCGGKVKDFEKMRVIDECDLEMGKNNIEICPDLFERFIVFASGDIGFCSADQEGYFEFGNIIENDPIGIYNNKTYQLYRNAMNEGRQCELKYCQDCTITNSRFNKTKPKINKL